MSEEKSSVQLSLLPKGFLRGLETDLRGLCADARRRNPEVKEAAERVILLLKEADSADAERNAADEAASAFCAACETLDPNGGSTAQSLQVKIALRAVSCLHKLLTHRALSPARLHEVLDALQRLSSPSLDDNLTLKVLQGVLSLLTVRSYAKSLSTDELSRAFSLLFILRTSRSSSAGTAASNAFSAISHMSGISDGGVIEQTSKAAFRQVSSDLFASAADSAVRTAVEKQAPTGAAVPLLEFPSEVQAAYSLFTDLCRAASGEGLTWIAAKGGSNPASMTSIDLPLALEVLDDALASNMVLFGGQQVFSEVLSSRLCPVLHTLLRTTVDKMAVKSLLGLVVTLSRNYWRLLKEDSEALLYALAKKVKEREANEAQDVSWGAVFAMESIRSIFKSKLNEPNNLADFVKAFDLGESSGRLIASIVNIACDTMSLLDKVDVRTIPPSPISGFMKPFANTITNSTEFLVAIATGVYLEVVKAAGDASKSHREDVTNVLLMTDTTERAVTLLGKLIWESSSTGQSSSSSPMEAEASLEALTALAESLGRLATTATECNLEGIREKALATLSTACKNATLNCGIGNSSDPESAKRVAALYEVLFRVHENCHESLGRSWLSVVEALEQLDILLIKVGGTGESDLISNPVVADLRPMLDLVFTSTTKMSWTSCQDLISALVQCSRQAVALISKRLGQEDQSKLDNNGYVRVFGILMAEKALLHSFRRENDVCDAIPGSLWQMLTGHLTSICTDSEVFALRQVGLGSLTRLACGAIPSGNPPVVGHDKIIRPFLDLFTASHFDVRSGSLSAVYTILEAQGERLSGEAAWLAVLKILSTAAGSGKTMKDNRGPSIGEGRSPAQASASSAQSIEMMPEAFKVVQTISDDFLTSLEESVLPVWIDVLSLYCRQNEDVNVALTSIGLLWRTADFFAKSTGLDSEDELWVQLFETLKEVSMDERPEIRNSAVKTLTGTLSAHSFRLSALAWNGCVARALLPLLEEVMQGGASPQSEDGALQGKGRGDVQLLLHHSRDTPRKQWNETRVLALAGVAKVLRTAMPRLSILEDESSRPLFLMLTDGGADGLWRKMLRAAGVAAGSRDKEVAVAGVSALLELLSAAGFVVGDRGPDVDTTGNAALEGSRSAPAVLGGEASSASWIAGVMGSSGTSEAGDLPSKTNALVGRIPGSAESTILFWEAVWTALNEAIGGIEKQTTPNGADEKQAGEELKIVDESALQMLAEGLLESRVKLASKFTPGSSRMLVEVLMRLALGRPSISSKTEVRSTAALTEVQEATLKGLQTLSFGTDRESWTSLVQGLLAIVERESQAEGSSNKLARRVLVIIGSLYANEELPEDVKLSELPKLLKVMGSIMLLRDEGEGLNGRRSSQNAASSSTKVGNGSGEGRALWIEATEVVIRAMQCHVGSAGQPQSEDVWAEFAKLAEEFLYAPQRIRRDQEFGHDKAVLERTEDYDIQLTACVQDALGEMAAGMPEETKRHLVGLLSRGAEEGKASCRPRFVRSCQKRLFRLADSAQTEVMGRKETAKKHIAEESNRRVVETCGRVLGQFIADGQRAGRCPLPAARRAEAVFLLQQLRKLNSYDGDGHGGFSKEHLVTLYPRLCECVDSRDEAVRQLARELLDEAAPGTRDSARKGSAGAALRA